MSRFQYVRFQLEELRELSSIPEIRKALVHLPVGLDATYDRILQNIDIKFQGRVINSLKWLAFSKRVLAVEELAEIFIIDPEKDTAFDENARLFSSSAMTRYFSGLIVIEKGQGVSKDKVRLVHFSVKEYLTSGRIEGRLALAFSFSEADAHTYIARSCLAYLTHLITTAERSTKQTLSALKETHPLFPYAVNYWGIHLEEVPRAQWPAKVILSAVLALADHSLSLLFFTHKETRAGNDFRHMLKKPHCYTAFRGFRQLTEMMIAQKFGANEYITQEDLDFGLHYAAYRGHLDIVQFFFEKGANLNANCGNWDSAVHAAVSGGHMNVLEFFVSHGVDVNSQPPLFACISKWDTQVLKYLLHHGLDMEMQDDQRRTALHKAITDNNSTQFDILLEKGADINAPSEKFGTPLHAACVGLAENYWRRDKSEELRRFHYIEKLLDCGADPNIQGGKFATALQAVCSTECNGKLELPMEVVRLLIAQGADVNIQGGHWGSALNAAAASPNYHSDEKIEMMKLLLDNGAKLDQRDNNDGETPLHVACYEGTIEAVRFLVDRGADVNAEGGRFGTPILHAVAATRYDSIPFLTLLMDKGANVNYQGGEYGSALQAHFHGNFKDVESFRFLLKHCADVNAKGGRYLTALIAACASPYSQKECVRLLLDHGADVNTGTQSEEYGTELIAACQPGRYHQRDTQAVQWLLECGADVQAQGGKHGTALSTACSWNCSEAVELLLSHGANIHLRDFAAWHSAIREITTRDVFSMHKPDSSGEAVILELLLHRGMDINHEHAEYGTALHAMMNEGRAGPNWREGINVLLKHRINPNIMNERLGSALHVACALNHEDVHADFEHYCSGCDDINTSSSKAAYLLDQCPNINVNAQGGPLGTALQAAAHSGQTLSVRMLLDREANVDARSGKYHSALNGAIIGGRWNIVKILLAAGATPDCHLQGQPNEDWLQTVSQEDGRGAVERYRKFWQVELEKKRGGGASNL